MSLSFFRFFSSLLLSSGDTHSSSATKREREREKEKRHPAVHVSLSKHMCQQEREREKRRTRERVVSYLCIHPSIYWQSKVCWYSNQIDSMIMNSTVADPRKCSLWTMLTSEPLYVLIPNLFLIRPIRFLLNYYVKPAKFLVIVLPRNIWRKGNVRAPVVQNDPRAQHMFSIVFSLLRVWVTEWVFTEYEHRSVANLNESTRVCVWKWVKIKIVALARMSVTAVATVNLARHPFSWESQLDHRDYLVLCRSLIIEKRTRASLQRPVLLISRC